jgi:hypothetical protein
MRTAYYKIMATEPHNSLRNKQSEEADITLILSLQSLRHIWINMFSTMQRRNIRSPSSLHQSDLPKSTFNDIYYL